MTNNLSAQIQPTLAQITIYPIKSLDGANVDRVQISPGGALAFDRRWAIVDNRGKVVNAKRTAKIQTLRSQFDLDRGLISLQSPADSNTHTFALTEDAIELTTWLSQFFEFPVSLIENAVNGFPDDLNAYGPTIISTATLEAICAWFPDLDLPEVRRRFRTNLELSEVPAFWEDCLFTTPGATVDFQLGDVRFRGINSCQRCPVPTRDSRSGIPTPNFQKTFTQYRQHDLPDWVNTARFNHFYRLAVNTQIPLLEAGKFLHVGDGVEALSNRTHALIPNVNSG
jgi:uncharacterized protein